MQDGVAPSGLVPNVNPQPQGFVSLHPVLLYYGALPLDPAGIETVARIIDRILKGFKVKAQGVVKRSPEICDVNVRLGLKARQVLKNKNDESITPGNKLLDSTIVRLCDCTTRQFRKE